jgi:hypothetical protein
MTEETIAQETPTKAAAPAPAPAKPKRVAAVLSLSAEGVDPLKAIKYPMPLKAPRFEMSINGQLVKAAQTTFGAIKYTYFEFGGASFYVPGHLSQEPEYTFSFPEGYNFTPMKLDRAATAAAAALAAAAKKAAAAPKSDAEGADADPESALEGVETASGSEGSPTISEGATEPIPAPTGKGKKAKR